MKQNNKWMLVAIALLALVALPLVGCKHEADSGVKAPKMVLVEGGTVEGDTPPWLEGTPEATEKGVFVKGRTVTLSDFYIGRHEVTQAEWKAVMGQYNDPSNFKGDNFPVERVSWYDAVVYCNKRSMKEGLNPCYEKDGSTDPDKWEEEPDVLAKWNAITCNFTANGYRLPTEAEWEYAARGGNPSDKENDPWNYMYAGTNDKLGEYAWYGESVLGGGTPHQVGTKKANSLGLYDMSGNESEWCWDWYEYPIIPKTDDAGNIMEEHNPKGPETWSGSSTQFGRVGRGGGWHSIASDCWVSHRTKNGQFNYLGFRVVRSLGTTEEPQ